MKLSAIALVLELVLPFCVPSQADEPARNGPAEPGRLAPFQMQVFCSKNPSECRPAPSASAKWNSELEILLVTINYEVNKDIRPQANSKRTWTINPASGDCNDYVLTKRSRLMRAGVPPGALRLAITATRDGIPHMILVVRTSIGDVVLDNLSDEVKTLRRSGYSVRSISGANPLRWIRS